MTGPITPPSCAVCFITAGVAGEGASGLSVGWTAMRLAAVAYVLPFAFVYNPALLLMGGLLETVLSVTTAIVGVILLAIGLQGWFFGRMNFLIRIILSVAGIMFIWPWFMADFVGLVIAAPTATYQLLRIRREMQPQLRQWTKP